MITLFKRKRDTFYSPRNDKTFVIKCADRGSAVVIFDMEDYTKEAENQDTDIYEEELNDANPNMNTNLNTLENKIIRKGIFVLKL